MNSTAASLAAALALAACADSADESTRQDAGSAATSDQSAHDAALAAPLLDADTRSDLSDANLSGLDGGFCDLPDALRESLPDAALVDGAALPYARVVATFMEGPNAGFGRERFPEIVLGPPRGQGTMAGSLDVLSLGTGGVIVLDLGERAIVDGPGADFIVFENPFWPGGQRASVYAELGEVSVSIDRAEWRTFPCDGSGRVEGVYPGCAGWTPTLAYDALALTALDPVKTGGDAFDLAAIGMARARYVRIRDLSSGGAGDAAGFDLDALGVIHSAE